MATILWLLASLFAQAIVILYPGVFVFWLIMHNFIDRLRPFGIRAYWVAALAWGLTSGPLLYFRSDMFSTRWIPPQPLNWILPAVGLVAFLLSVVFLSKAGREISFRTLVGLPEVEPQKNVQPVLNTGIYSKTRNPIYFGHWLLVFSAAAMTNYAANWIGFALDCLILPLLIRAEERELLARYGRDFADYMSRVPRFFPR
jgi:protein-S-isoprenylcysteine O-methyltransferase Ste14